MIGGDAEPSAAARGSSAIYATCREPGEDGDEVAAPSGSAWTRRDMLRGAFLRHLLSGAGAGRGTTNPGSCAVHGEIGAEVTRVGVPPEAGAVVVRYPKTADDVRRLRPPGSGGGGVIPVLRPPGAVVESRFLELCTRCGDCAGACPYSSIKDAPGRLRAIVGTPVIDPISQPCWLCTDAPCVAACKTGALDAKLEVRLGTAAIDTQTCLAHQKGVCSTCVERCPVEGAILVESGRPTVDQERCSGCGVCQYVCPAPENAVLLMPMFARPAPREGNRRTCEVTS